MSTKYAFLDRDGALIYEPTPADIAPGEVPYQIDSISKLKILDGVIDGLKSLVSDGFKLVMVSNQNGIGSDKFPKESFEAPQNRLLEIFAENDINFDEIFICPHFAEENCVCRKPKIGLVKTFFATNDIDMTNSFMYGDRETDREFAKNLGIKFIKAETNGEFRGFPILENKSRMATVTRNTKETKITISVNLDGKGKFEIDTGVGFLNHMLELFSKHSLIDLKVEAKGDLFIDEHHTIEDIGIVLGQAIAEALGEKRGIQRYGFLLPMDETLAEIALDLGGRPYLVWNVNFEREKVGEMPTELFEDFFQALTNSLACNLHINLRYGRNDHHKAEAIFKALAKAMKFAVSYDDRVRDLIPSTKGNI